MTAVLNRKIWKTKAKRTYISRPEAKNYQIAKATVLGKTFNAHFVHHHVAHLAGVYYCSPYSKASLISLDAGGEGINHHRYRRNKIKVLICRGVRVLGIGGKIAFTCERVE